MIEQYSSGMPQVSQPAAVTNRDRQAATEQDDKSGSFEDFVKAGDRGSDRTSKQATQKQDDDPRTTKQEIDLDRPVIDKTPKVAFELSAALRGLGLQQGNQQQAGQAPAQAKTQNFKEALKPGDRNVAADKQQPDAVLAKLVEKMKHAVQTEKPVAAEKAQAADQKQMTASDELSLLLGMPTSSKDVDAKHGKKSSAEQVDKSEKKSDADDKGTDAVGKKADANTADPMLITIDTRHHGKDDDAASDDNGSSSRGDVVRLVNANGRGRSVDIDVAVPGTQAQDGAKSTTSSNTPKVETATVLEARRYLGFSTETNGNALAQAIKSDPTWTEALQGAQRTDLSSLGNTVTEVNTLKIEMNPEHLGNMVATLKLKGEELTVELRVNSVEAYHHLSADHDDIVKSLQDQGFSIDKVTVQLNATDRTDTGADRDLRQGQGQSQGQRDGQTAQRDGQGNRNDGQPEQPRWTQSGQQSDGNSGDGSADAGRTGNIYL